MTKAREKNYIDLFAGCGGLSLGLGNAGWRGLFAVEKDPMAFATLKHNLVGAGSRYAHFDWPNWLPQEAITIERLLKDYEKELTRLKGKVGLVAGGPPCQGFSLAGQRNPSDTRNKLYRKYIKLVGIIQPRFILFENVRGFNAAFMHNGKTKTTPYSLKVKASLEEMGYTVFAGYIHSEHFGVPQARTRFVMIGTRKPILAGNKDTNPFALLADLRARFLESKGLPLKPIPVKAALSDLETTRRGARLVDYQGTHGHGQGYKQLEYRAPTKITPYQALMRNGLNGQPPGSMRLARHKPATLDKFTLIKKVCRPGYTLSAGEKGIIGTNKQALCVLDPKKPSRTITTLPDDLLHYKETRILTVRECARLQSFPDAFAFKGKYTTGGQARKNECPRYTQVGNAVPPLLAEALGWLVNCLIQKNYRLS